MHANWEAKQTDAPEKTHANWEAEQIDVPDKTRANWEVKMNIYQKDCTLMAQKAGLNC